MLDFGVLVLLGKKLVSTLSSCASWSESLWHTDSIAEINSTLGGLRRAREKLCPLENRDSCAGVKGTLDKLTTHLLAWLLLLESWT